jgi:autotransporter-associated beta strand protein
VRQLFAAAAVLSLSLTCLGAADDGSKDTPAAAATRKKLKQKVTVNFKDTRLEDVVDDLKEQVKGLRMQLDTKGGVSRNLPITWKGTDVTLAEALDGMFQKNGLGYIIISGKNNAYDGSIQIRQGKERGSPLKK